MKKFLAMLLSAALLCPAHGDGGGYHKDWYL